MYARAAVFRCSPTNTGTNSLLLFFLKFFLFSDNLEKYKIRNCDNEKAINAIISYASDQYCWEDVELLGGPNIKQSVYAMNHLQFMGMGESHDRDCKFHLSKVKGQMVS